MEIDRDEFERVRAELDELRAEIATVRRRGRWIARLEVVPTGRRLAIAGLTALMLALPVAVSANHVFSDVPTSSTYHKPIARLYGAAITGGCGSGRYCPNSAVTRGQMAAFLNRGLGRAAHDHGATFGDHWATLLPASDLALAVVTLRTGGGTGGTGHVLVQGNVTAWTREAGVCPCELSMFLYSWTGEASEPATTIIGSTPSPDNNDYRGAVSWSHLFTAPSGTEINYAIVARVTPTQMPTATFEADAFYSIQATYVPFDDQGANPDLPTTTSQVLPFGTSPSTGE